MSEESDIHRLQRLDLENVALRKRIAELESRLTIKGIDVPLDEEFRRIVDMHASCDALA
jgi:hypothetical protein